MRELSNPQLAVCSLILSLSWWLILLLFLVLRKPKVVKGLQHAIASSAVHGNPANPGLDDDVYETQLELASL
jgi:hypothetical protein